MVEDTFAMKLCFRRRWKLKMYNIGDDRRGNAICGAMSSVRAIANKNIDQIHQAESRSQWKYRRSSGIVSLIWSPQRASRQSELLRHRGLGTDPKPRLPSLESPSRSWLDYWIRVWSVVSAMPDPCLRWPTMSLHERDGCAVVGYESANRHCP